MIGPFTGLLRISRKIILRESKSCIDYETTKVTALAAAAGIPAGFAMLGTVPADLAQFYAHVIRIAQKLAYLYGYPDLSDSDNIDDSMRNLLILFIGVMSGIQSAETIVGKIIPIVGALVSGGMTYATFKPMANRFQKHLEEHCLDAVETGEI